MGMRNKIIVLFVLFAFVYGCKREEIFSGIVNFEILNVSFGVIKEVNIQIVNHAESINVYTNKNIAFNKKETKSINLSSFNIKGDASYKIVAILEDGKKLERSFGYITNGVDINGYTVEISNSEISLK